MPADASFSYARDVNSLTIAAAVAVGEIWQLPDGRAGAMYDNTAGVVGDSRKFTDTGKWVCVKTAGYKALKGGRAYWDHSANAISYRQESDRDFYVGRFVSDAASADISCTVEANIDPPYKVDLVRDAFASVLVGTPAVSASAGFGYPVRLGGTHIFELNATNEAQKVDLLSVVGFAKTANFIVDGSFRVLNDGAGTAPDFTIGLGSGTDATDFQNVAEFVAIHLDGNAVDIFAESDDGTTDVPPTDTTINYTEGSALAQRVYFSIDGRDPNDVQIYVNGSLVLDATTFTLTAASATLFLIIHLEKTAAADVYKIAVDELNVRIMEQD